MVNVKQGCGNVVRSLLDDSMIQSLTAICKAIKVSSSFIDGKTNITEGLLANLVKGLREHYETYYGKSSPKPRTITIPSARLFSDYSVNGPLHIILTSLLEGATVRDMLPVENLFTYPTTTILPILCDIDKRLASNGIQNTPLVFLNKVPVGQINRLSKIVLEHGGRIVSTEDKATHIVDWNDEIDANSISEDINRLVKVVSNAEGGGIVSVHVHWLYAPDSYDEIFSVEIDNLNEMADIQSLFTNYSLKTKYYVSCRFILDCEIFNEWGNESDYENSLTEEDDSQVFDNAGSSKRLKSKRKSSGNGVMGFSSSQHKRDSSATHAINANYPINTEKNFFPEVLPPSLCDVSSSAILDVTTNPPILQATFVESKDDDKPVLGKRSFDDDSRGGNVSWYSADGISELERRYLGNVIEESSTSSISAYISIRNAIVTFYQQNPTQFLTATECRRKVAGDVSKIVRVHEFLDAFGVINAQVKLEQRTVNNFEMLDDMAKSLKRKYLIEKIPKQLSSFLPNQTTIAPLKSSTWTVEMDDVLLSLLSTRKKDWRSIASEMEKLFSVSLVQCMMRFLEMPDINNSTHVGVATPNVTSYNSSISSCKEEPLNKLQQAVQMLERVQRTMLELKQMTRTISETTAEPNLSLQARVDAGESIALFLRQDIENNMKSLWEIVNTKIENKLTDFAENRLKIMEYKMDILKHIEIGMILEKEQIDVDKHEIIISKLSQGSIPLFSSSSFSNLIALK